MASTQPTSFEIHPTPIYRDQPAVCEKPVPVLTVKMGRIAVESHDGWETEYEDVEVPILELSFRYDRTTIRAADESDRIFLDDGGMRPVRRNTQAEDQARQLLESFGAVELSCVEGCVPEYGSHADYLIALGGDVHAFCNFGAYALPQLRALGWEVDTAEGYPYQVLSGDTPWYALAVADEAGSDWFSFELGIQSDGQRISLLPALLDLLDQCADETTLDALLRSAPRFMALRAADNLYVPVPADRLKQVLSVLRDLYDGRTSGPLKTRRSAEDALWLPFCRAGAVGEFENLSDGDVEIRVVGSDRLKQITASLRAEQETPVPPPALHTLKAELRPYQIEGVAWLQKMRRLGVGGVLADDMGLGKTLQTIAHLLAEKEAGRATLPSLIIAPTSLVGNWSREIAKFAPTLKVLILRGARRHKKVSKIAESDIVITTYPLILRDREMLSEREFYFVVLDEAQAIKNPQSQAASAVRDIVATHRLCLSGTPVENNLGELWSLFDFLTPGLLGSGAAFLTRFRQPIEQGCEDALNELRQRVSPFILRRLKTQVAKDLPPKTEIVRPVDLSEEQRELYEGIRVSAHNDVRQVIRKKGLAASTIPVLDALMKLRQVCCDPRLVRVPAARKVKGSAKFEALMDLVQSQTRDGHRILVFSQFTSMLDLISKGLDDLGIKHLILTGATNNRQAQIDAFQGGAADVFLISLKAGGTGLNLTRADTIIHYDPWWNPAAQDQATDRSHRIGQTNPVFVYSLIVAGSVEERMLQLQQRKRKLAGSVLDAGGQGVRSLGEDDLEDLFAPLE